MRPSIWAVDIGVGWSRTQKQVGPETAERDPAESSGRTNHDRRNESCNYDR